jgi:ribosomal protein S18 acetylase RimI-like enzyme
VRIGPLEPVHAGEVLTVQRAAYVVEAQRHDAPHIPPLRETLAEVAAEIAAADIVTIGAWLGPRLVGSIRGRADLGDPAVAEVRRFSVAPDVQRGGIGRRLLAELESAMSGSVRRFWLITGSRSDDNVRFYRRHGYQVVGTVADDVGVPLLRLAKDPHGGC